eukprot:385630_1
MKGTKMKMRRTQRAQLEDARKTANVRAKYNAKHERESTEEKLAELRNALKTKQSDFNKRIRSIEKSHTTRVSEIRTSLDKARISHSKAKQMETHARTKQNGLDRLRRASISEWSVCAFHVQKRSFVQALRLCLEYVESSVAEAIRRRNENKSKSAEFISQNRVEREKLMVRLSRDAHMAQSDLSRAEHMLKISRLKLKFLAVALHSNQLADSRCHIFRTAMYSFFSCEREAHAHNECELEVIIARECAEIGMRIENEARVYRLEFQMAQNAMMRARFEYLGCLRLEEHKRTGQHKSDISARRIELGKVQKSSRTASVSITRMYSRQRAKVKLRRVFNRGVTGVNTHSAALRACIRSAFATEARMLCESISASENTSAKLQSRFATREVRLVRVSVDENEHRSRVAADLVGALNDFAESSLERVRQMNDERMERENEVISSLKSSLKSPNNDLSSDVEKKSNEISELQKEFQKSQKEESSEEKELKDKIAADRVTLRAKLFKLETDLGDLGSKQQAEVARLETVWRAERGVAAESDSG